jgi:pimeloyl-ACP methyl ester carboxylesterase
MKFVMRMKSTLLFFIFGSLFLYLSQSVFAQTAKNESKPNVEPTPTWIGYGDVGKGRKMYMECRGTGSPTVILIAGLGNRADYWRITASEQYPSVFSEASTFTRVCAYDRPGTMFFKEDGFDKSRSDAIPQPTTAGQAADDLHALLAASNQSGPYVLVGHSAGGLVARIYAAKFPQEVAGLVLVDALSEDLYNQLSQDDKQFYDKKLNGLPKELIGHKELNEFERLDYVRSFGELKPVNPYLPTIVITADKAPDFDGIYKSDPKRLEDMPAGFPTRLWSAQVNAQNNLAKLFEARKNSAQFAQPATQLSNKHITQTNSGHYVQVEQPQIVSESIREVVDRVRKSQRS